MRLDRARAECERWREGVVQLNKSTYLSQKVQGSDSSQPRELHRSHSLLLPKREGLRIMRIQVKCDLWHKQIKKKKPRTQADKEREGIPAIHRRVCEGPSSITSLLCASLLFCLYFCYCPEFLSLSPICWKGLIQFHFPPASYILKSLL